MGKSNRSSRLRTLLRDAGLLEMRYHVQDCPARRVSSAMAAGRKGRKWNPARAV